MSLVEQVSGQGCVRVVYVVVCLGRVAWSLCGWLMHIWMLWWETKLGWMALGEGQVRDVWRWPWATEEWRWKLLVNAQNIGKSGEPWYICNWMSFIQPFLLGPVFFCTALLCSGGYHLERGRMPLHHAVGINCN